MIERLLVGRDELASLAGQTILITGADGMLASAFCDMLADVSGCRVVALNRRALDVRTRFSRESVFAQWETVLRATKRSL